MEYLLLNGSTTSNLNTYIRDVLFLNFNTLPSEIPFNSTLGLNRYILESSELVFMDKAKSSITDLLDNLNNRHGIKLFLSDLTLRNQILYVEIGLNDGDTQSYEIPTLNI
jgi:hypothetical protein